MSRTVGFLITARLKSSRLPLKLLAEIDGVPIVRHVIRRAKAVLGVDRVVLCTSDHPQDRILIDVAHEEGIFYFAGSQVDVLTRLGDAATLFGLDCFISMTADNPAFCTYHAHRVANALRVEDGLDFVHTDGLPLGTAVYGLSTSAVKAACELKQHDDTEIWGNWLNRPDFFNVKTLTATPGFDVDTRLTVDYPEDYRLMLEIASQYDGAFDKITLPDIFRIFSNSPDLPLLNSRSNQSAQDPLVTSAINMFFEENSDLVRNVIKKWKNRDY